MKLHYFHGRAPLKDLVMLRDDQRIELHIRPVGDGLWGLVALSGTDQERPSGQLLRGPWKTVVSAESTLRSIAGSMMGEGYDPKPDDYVLWSVAAQRLARTIGTPEGESATPEADPVHFKPLI
ncbi:hypothetical protein [Marinobacter sp. F3R08]|uniref:PA4575 family protein n=1 Tax=Marinobacter sp. F3R08 TaxID=2841559 RepID=UPI001C0A0E76|nr:hypothetical protein [Marinobacter sp. F3R08]MBU2953140.1 hypothetical protein [Marinobacter sp. F3R08]